MCTAVRVPKPTITQLDSPADAFDDGFESMWCVFWIVTTLGYDGRMGTGAAAGQVIIAVAIVAGLLLTTMPITIIGEAFHRAWDRKEMIEIQIRVQV